jgi:hypothetical protein
MQRGLRSPAQKVYILHKNSPLVELYVQSHPEAVRDLQAAARTLGPQLHVVHGSTQADLDTVFGRLPDLAFGHS